MTNPRPYRAKPIDPKQAGEDGWVYGFHCIWQGIEYIFTSPWNLYHKGWYEVHPESVGQSTGETDKNGKMIYEGDEVSTGFWGGVVKFKKGSFKVIQRGCSDSELGDFSESFEIITEQDRKE